MRKIIVVVAFFCLPFARTQSHNVDTGQDVLDLDSCINSTRSKGEYRDCCDCVGTDDGAPKEIKKGCYEKKKVKT